jgi:CO/xanthine dehydrogenase Mo-binding subunit
VNGRKAIFSFSAVFAEVRVDPDFGLVRLNRVVGAYDATGKRIRDLPITAEKLL